MATLTSETAGWLAGAAALVGIIAGLLGSNVDANASPAADRYTPRAAHAAQRAKRHLRSGLYAGGGANEFLQYVAVRVGSTRRRATTTLTLTVDCPRFGSSLVDTLTVRRARLRGGRLAFEAPYREQVPLQVRQIGGLQRTGVATGRLWIDRRGRAAGRIRNRFTLTDPETKRTVGRCDTGAVPWTARLMPRVLGRVEQGRPTPAKGARYVGATRQQRSLLLDVARNGRAIQRIGMAFDSGCPSALGRPLELSARRIRIVRRGARRGRFAESGGFIRTITDPRLGPLRERYAWRLTGRFGPRTVAGSWRVSARALRTDTGAEVTRCTTGRNRWRAVR